MTISELMTTAVVTVTMDDTLEIARALFEKHGFHHLLVVEDKELFGVVSDRDLLKALSPRVGTQVETTRDRATLQKKIHQVMTRKLTTLGPDASVYEAMRLFADHKISCLPVVDSNQQPLGIVSWRDIQRAMLTKLDEALATRG